MALYAVLRALAAAPFLYRWDHCRDEPTGCIRGCETSKLAQVEPVLAEMRYRLLCAGRSDPWQQLQNAKTGEGVTRVIFELLLERFAIDPKRAVYIDDVAANVDAARLFGIHTVHFTTPSALRSGTGAKPHLFRGTGIAHRST